MNRATRAPLAALGRLLDPVHAAADDAIVGPTLDPVLAIADRHGLVPAAYGALVRGGAVDAVPPSLVRHVATRSGTGSPLVAAAVAHAANAARVADQLDQAIALLDALQEAGLPAAPLKGVDALLAGRYPDPVDRTMTDIDVLVAAGDADAAVAVLTDLGYRPAPGAPLSAHQRPAMAAPGREGSVELHTALLVDRWARALPAAEALARARPAPDGPGLRLDRTTSAAHLVAHAQLQDEAHRLALLPLRAVHESALLLAGDEGVDWAEVAARFELVGQRPALETHLALASLLLRAPPPIEPGRRARAQASIVIALEGHPSAQRLVGRVSYLPRALAAERMHDLYGSTGPASRAVARARHLGATPARTLARRRR